jgi:NAD(P)-dependent dehydrogenase (short-subunit alcohol dehydrogenase family)
VWADLSDLAQVRRLAEDVREVTDRLDVFVSNAGVGSGEPDGRTRRTSADGYELRFAVNYLAGFLLTLELLPLLRASAPARIVNVASLGQHPLGFDDLMLEHGYSGLRAYGQSKLAQIMSGFELACRVPAAEVTVNGLHPATYMPTKMVLAEVGHHIDTLEDGVDATCRLITDPGIAQTTGRFFDRTGMRTAPRATCVSASTVLVPPLASTPVNGANETARITSATTVQIRAARAVSRSSTASRAHPRGAEPSAMNAIAPTPRSMGSLPGCSMTRSCPSTGSPTAQTTIVAATAPATPMARSRLRALADRGGAASMRVAMAPP